MSNETELAPRDAGAVSDGESTVRRATLVPAVDIVEDKTGVTVWADLPGVPKDKLDIRVHDGNLSIEAEAVISMPDGLNMTHREVRASRYVRAFSVSADLDTAKIDASLQDGVLTLRIPRREAALPRRIEVKGA
ncbi:Hsp20/alpha crystallin family protein [Trinickia soli]|uniref:Hsp20/alpha crystallin family protein n=1 Tax=Trinickia soli TaxID=380675 RepID=UPI00125BD8AD|nr:Hsp20/alpha crystallin family protein [Paraburkholderia sp. T12-10]